MIWWNYVLKMEFWKWKHRCSSKTSNKNLENINVLVSDKTNGVITIKKNLQIKKTKVPTKQGGIKESRKQYEKKRRDLKVCIRWIMNTRCRIYHALNGVSNSTSTGDIVGTDIITY